MAKASPTGPGDAAAPSNSRLLSSMHLKKQMSTRVNPSGAAAPLDEEGYNAVADRCCQAEMKIFIERVVFQNDLQICSQGGLEGFVPFHSCGAVDRSYAKLTTELMDSSTSDCPWVQSASGDCQPLPDSCPSFPDVPAAAPCQCSRSAAAKVDFATTQVIQNNIGGQGPDSGDEELRFTGLATGEPAGTSSTGEPFDIVITTERTDYNPGNNRPNGKWGQDFGVIYVHANTNAGLTGSFKFSFVKPGTNDPVTLSEIHMTVFDLDGGGASNTEFTSSKGYAGFVTDPNTNLEASKLADGRTEFTGTKTIDAKVGLKNGANAIDTDQREGACMFFYRDVASFELEFGRAGIGGPSGLVFAFTSNLNELCEE